MVFGKYGEALLRRVERGTLRDGEALQRAADLEPEVVVGVGRVVQMADETAVLGGPLARLAFRREGLVRRQRIAFFAVFSERVATRARFAW